MKINCDEANKLLYFLLENKNLIDKETIDLDNFLNVLEQIIRNETLNNFIFTDDHIKLFTNLFLKSKCVFDENTPLCILKSEKCVRATIKRDIKSINYIKIFNIDWFDIIEKEAILGGYILSKESPIFMQTNFKVALNSIKLDAFSADYIKWEDFSKKEANILIDEAIENGYILSENSHYFLTKNWKIAIASLKKDKNSLKFVNELVKNNLEVYKYLILNNFSVNVKEIASKPLACFLDEKVMEKSLHKLRVHFNCSHPDRKLYVKRYNKLFSDALNNYPKIKNFEPIFKMCAEKRWIEHRNSNQDLYENIFGKICAQLKKDLSFNEVIRSLKFLGNMKYALGKKYDTLLLEMEKYYDIYHSENSDKIKNSQNSKDIIASLSALYVSISKENFKKELFDDYNEMIMPYFSINLKHPVVAKMARETAQKEEFSYRYKTDDLATSKFINELISKYSLTTSKKLVEQMINLFILQGRSKIESIIDAPIYYQEYKDYEKTIKLIRRLNHGYISIDGPEVNNYKKLIRFDKITKQYYYYGLQFDDFDIEEFNEYYKNEQIFEKIKKEIMTFVKSIKVENQDIDKSFIETLNSKFSFNDKYFSFDSKCLVTYFVMSDLLDLCMDKYNGFIPDGFINDGAYQMLYNLIIQNALIWLLLFQEHNVKDIILDDYDVTSNCFIEIINNINDIFNLAKKAKLNGTYENIVLLNEICQLASIDTIAILGADIVSQLCTNKEYTNGDELLILSKAKELVALMTIKDKSTVPYISGETNNYKYCLYDSQDVDILLAGIKTDACFKIDGNDNDFLHYCALDKNGFIIKITDSFGNFIARAAGFRNGNAVFVNQLRTIYDEAGDNYLGNYESEKNEIIETFKKACEDIVLISQQNEKEENKIDFVFVTKSYALSRYNDHIVSNEVEEKIGDYPMDNKSEDWYDFLESTQNLDESLEDNYFMTDYGSYKVICMASSKNGKKILTKNLIFKDVPALYERKRNDVIVTNNITAEIYQKINRINAIYSLFNSIKFAFVEIPKDSTVYVGDNWYAIFCGSHFMDSKVLAHDEKAKKEYKSMLKMINEKLIEEYKNRHQVRIRSLK